VSRSDRHRRGQARCDDPCVAGVDVPRVTAGDVPFVPRPRHGWNGSAPNGGGAPEVREQIASAPCGSRTAAWSIAAEGGFLSRACDRRRATGGRPPPLCTQPVGVTEADGPGACLARCPPRARTRCRRRGSRSRWRGRRCGGSRITGGESITEAVAFLGRVRNAGAVLGEQLPARAGQAGGRAIHHADRPRIAEAADGLERGAGGQISKAVMVEIPDRQRLAEEVARLGAAGDPGTGPGRTRRPAPR
jgi:hypothetical protein